MKLPIMPSFSLLGRRALITGASGSIGLASAVALAEAGAKVTLMARNECVLKSLSESLTDTGCYAEYIKVDIANLDELKKNINERQAFDVVVNAAGISRNGSALDTVEEDYQAVMDVNVKAAYFLSSMVASKIKSSGKSASIIHISSQMAHVGGIDRAVYCASKHAVEGMTKAMAMEWGSDNIRVNTICPTFIRTPLTESTFKDTKKNTWIKSKIKLPRVGKVEDIMGAVVFLASDASSMITGSSLMIDGGWTIG